MKKIMLTVAGMLLVSLMAVNAQVLQDTASTTMDQPPVHQDDQSNLTRDMEVVQPSDLPESLRTTLGGAEYTGWEEGQVYRNTTTNEYLIVVGDDDAKVFRFDANGSKIEDLNSGSENSGQVDPGSGSTDDGTTGSTTTEEAPTN